MIANLAVDGHPSRLDGAAAPGHRAAILRRDDHGRVVVDDGEVEEIHDPATEGELALRPGWPSMFRGYLNERGPLPHVLRRRVVPVRRPRPS